MTNAPQELPALPALRCLGALADVRPTIVVDTREQDPLTFARLASERAALQTGDYSFRGGEDLFAVERKSIPDLVSCCVGESRERFFRELHRLRGFRFKRLLIIGTHGDIEAGAYRSSITPRAVLAPSRASRRVSTFRQYSQPRRTTEAARLNAGPIGSRGSWSR